MSSFSEKTEKLKQYKTIVIALLLAGAVIYGVTSCTEKKDERPPKGKTTSTQISMAPSQNEYERHQAVYNERLMRLEKESRDAKNREAKLEKDKRRLEERLAALERGSKSGAKTPITHESKDGWPPADVIGKIPSSNSPVRKGFESGAGATASSQRYSAQGSASPSERAPRLTVVSFDGANLKDSAVIGKSEKDTRSKPLMYLPSGTFAQARLLNGATAPTRGQGSGNPVPILLELTDSAVMPNLYKAGIKRCFVTANATGELASERVLVRLDRLSCIDENGGAVDKKIQGYVSGEDGKTGLRARLVTKSGQAIANALFTGTLAGLGKAVSLASENSTTSITGTISTTVTNPWRAGVGEGASHAMDRITDYYLKLASDMFPVLEVDSGRKVEIVISNGLSIERIDDK
ncbi:TrbI/VirB10 family protein [uncultured Parasutterella sp.]|uniref:TrbI/VirB10 family protein n=1 Tax=uncultured Parasutterella sp. TaxID=1263098 RepID=UPI0025969692|nr:TrbI/VirB10 family protein [uncultured Parasutterella sp.]